MSVPTLSDVKTALNITGSTYDDLLYVYLNAALKMIEARTGPSSVVTKTETVQTNSNMLLLRYRPVVAITSITANLTGWPDYTAADVAFDARSGAVWRKDMGTLAGSYDVTYTAGWETFPDNYHLATLITIQHLWRTQRGGSKRPNQGGTDELSLHIGSGLTRTLQGGSITLPAAAIELLIDSPYYGGIA